MSSNGSAHADQRLKVLRDFWQQLAETMLAALVAVELALDQHQDVKKSVLRDIAAGKEFSHANSLVAAEVRSSC